MTKCKQGHVSFMKMIHVDELKVTISQTEFNSFSNERVLNERQSLLHC